MEEVQSLMRRLYPLYRFGDGEDDDNYDVSTVVPELSRALGSVRVSCEVFGLSVVESLNLKRVCGDVMGYLEFLDNQGQQTQICS